MEAVCTLGNKNNNQGKQRKNNPVNEKSWFGEGKERKKKSEREPETERDSKKIQKKTRRTLLHATCFSFLNGVPWGGTLRYGPKWWNPFVH